MKSCSLRSARWTYAQPTATRNGNAQHAEQQPGQVDAEQLHRADRRARRRTAAAARRARSRPPGTAAARAPSWARTRPRTSASPTRVCWVELGRGCASRPWTRPRHLGQHDPGPRGSRWRRRIEGRIDGSGHSRQSHPPPPIVKRDRPPPPAPSLVDLGQIRELGDQLTRICPRSTEYRGWGWGSGCGGAGAVLLGGAGHWVGAEQFAGGGAADVGVAPVVGVVRQVLRDLSECAVARARRGSRSSAGTASAERRDRYSRSSCPLAA